MSVTGEAVVLHAWVDESIHQAEGDRDGIYVLAAAVADPATCDPTRDTLRALLARGAARLHWRDESEPRRTAITEAIVSCDLTSTVVVGIGVDHKRQERARRKCMERLLHELDALSVSRTWLEARTETLNRRDLQMVNALRGSSAISANLRVEFGLPSQEPMLWVPDAVAGAVGAARKGTQPAHRKRLGDLVTELDISL